MSRLLLLLICSLLLGASPIHAQLTLPGAAPAAPRGASATAPKPEKSAGAASKGAAAGKSAKLAAGAAPGVAGLDGKPLLLNGAAGLLQISGDDNAVRIDRLRLAGEGALIA